MKKKIILKLAASFVIITMILAGCAPSSDDNKGAKSTAPTSESTAPTTEDTTKGTSKVAEGTSSKETTEAQTTEQEEKDYAYADAQFTDLDLTEYNLKTFERDGYKNSPDSIKIPQISLDTDGGREFNKRLKEYANKMAKRLQNAEEDGWEYPDIKYEVIRVNDRYLSVLITNSGETMDSSSAATFDLKTGEMLSQEDIVKYAGGIEKFGQELEKAVSDSSMKADESSGLGDEFAQFEHKNLTDIWIQLYRLGSLLHDTELNSNPAPRLTDALLPESNWEGTQTELKSFIAGENKIGVITTLYTPAGSGYSEKIIYLENPADTKTSQPGLNPLYEFMAYQANIDPRSDSAPQAFTAFLGYMGKVEDAKYKLQNLLTSAGIKMQDISAFRPYSDSVGDEIYLVIGKYKKTSMAIYYEHSREDEEKYYSLRKQSGPNLLLVANKSSGRTDTDIRVYFRDGYIKYSPQTDQIELKNLHPDEMADISDLMPHAETRITEETENKFKEIME